MMFMIIVAGLAALLLFFSSMLIKGGFIGSGDRYFPCFQAVVAAALFFVLLDALQMPLAYSADVGAGGMVMGILGTLLLTFPVMFMDYAPRRQATSQEVVDKAKALLDSHWLVAKSRWLKPAFLLLCLRLKVKPQFCLNPSVTS
jgi:hypothetical protein